MMNRGYIKLYRKIVDTGMLADAPMLQVWCWLLLHATHKPRQVSYKGEYYHLEPGDVFASIRTIARDTKVSIGIAKRRLDALESEQTIERRTTHRGTIVSICNWGFYQSATNTEKHTDRTQNDTQTEHRRNTDGTQTEQEQECKNVKINYSEYGDVWNRLCEGSGLARVQVWSDKRKAGLRRLLKESWFSDNWTDIFEAAHNSKWCKDNKADITHVLRYNNALRYYEKLGETRAMNYKKVN